MYQLHIFHPTMANCDEQIVTAVGISYSNRAREVGTIQRTIYTNL